MPPKAQLESEAKSESAGRWEATRLGREGRGQAGWETEGRGFCRLVRKTKRLGLSLLELSTVEVCL